MNECNTRPDFAYDDHLVQIYVDGPAHQYPERAQRDADQQSCLEDLGHTVIRFAHTDDWEATIRKFPSVFGELRSTTGDPKSTEPDLDLFDPQWRPIVERIAAIEGVHVTGGGDVTQGGAVVGSTVMTIERGEATAQILDADNPQSTSASQAVVSAGGHPLEVSASDADAAVARILDELGLEQEA